MLGGAPMLSVCALAAACRALGVSWCWPTISQPASSKAFGAEFSLGGSYQVRVQTTLIFALGFTDHTPSAKALTPATTVVIGWAATKPIVLALVILPATIPVR